MNPILLLALILGGELPLDKDENNICENCLFLFNGILDFVRDENNQETVKELLTIMCHILPNKEETTICLNLVDKYLDNIFEEMLKHTSEEYCSTIGLCNSPTICF